MNVSFKVNRDDASLIKKVLFVCVHNSGQSQMAEALFNHYAAGKAQAFSAGPRPASHTDRAMAEAMKEIGIDVSAQRPKMLTLQMVEDANKVITLGCGVEGICPATSVPTENWPLQDPEGKPIEKVRDIRDEIGGRVKKFIEEIQHEGRIKTNAY